MNKYVKNTLRVVFVLTLPAISFYSTATLLYALAPPQSQMLQNELVIQPSSPRPTRINPPVRLAIQSIKLNAAVQPVGVTKQGDMAIGPSIKDVAWYKNGPKPGEPGSAVIAGHYGWKNGRASVFNDVHTLKKGDKVVVYDEQDMPMTFIVQKTKRYDPTADAKEVFISNDGKSHLNLITCEGAWNNTLQK